MTQLQTAKNAPSPTTCPPEVQKLCHENACLRIDKKKQDEQLQLLKESEQTRFENMRSLLDDKARELNHLQKQLRQQIARLVSTRHLWAAGPTRCKPMGHYSAHPTEIQRIFKIQFRKKGKKENQEKSR